MKMPDPDAADVLCANCGRSVPAKRWVCPYCGAALDSHIDEQHAYRPPLPPHGPFQHAIPLHRRSPEDDFEPLRASRWPSLITILELLAVLAVLAVLVVLARGWLSQNEVQKPPPAADSAPDNDGSSAIFSREMEGAPRRTPTSGPSPTPFVLFLPTPKGNDSLPPVMQEALPGEGVLQITSGKGRNYSPALSRDQRRLIYTSQIDGHWQIVEVRPDSGEFMRQITSGEIDYYTPLFNADGSQILVVADWSVNLDIFLLSYESGQVLRQLTFAKEADFAPAWLPDYSGIVFTSMRDGDAELYYLRIPEIQVDEPEVTRLTEHPGFDGYPSVSHDGEWVTFYSDRAQEYLYDIYVMLLSTRVVRRLSKDSARDAFPVYAPGDAWIIFESNRSGNYELYAVRPNAIDDSAAENMTFTEANEYMPAFSPDGLWLFYLSDYYGGMDIYRRPWP